MKPIAIDDFCAVRSLANVTFSPEGTSACFTVSQAKKEKNCYKSRLYLLKGGRVRALTGGGKESSFCYLDENTVLFAGDREGEKEPSLTSRFYKIALDGGEADLAAIAAVKAAVRIPVVGNGDVKDAESARAMRETGCDGIMIGRGALGNPWVFQEIRAALSGRTYTPPDWQERMETAVEHIRATVSHKGERGVLELRKHIVCYLAGVRGAAQFRTRLQAATSAEEMAETLLDTCRQREYNGEAHRA